MVLFAFFRSRHSSVTPQQREGGSQVCLEAISVDSGSRHSGFAAYDTQSFKFLGIREQINNPGFNPIEFDGIKKQAGLNSFILTAKQWIGVPAQISTSM